MLKRCVHCAPCPALLKWAFFSIWAVSSKRPARILLLAVQTFLRIGRLPGLVVFSLSFVHQLTVPAGRYTAVAEYGSGPKSGRPPAMLMTRFCSDSGRVSTMDNSGPIIQMTAASAVTPGSSTGMRLVGLESRVVSILSFLAAIRSARHGIVRRYQQRNFHAAVTGAIFRRGVRHYRVDLTPPFGFDALRL